MTFFRNVGMEPLAWSLRRLHCPVSKDALVLEVGSGGNPYWRANVLCDAYWDTSERHFEKLVHDRPTVLGLTENLPFRDDSFDFVIASHVLEHSTDPGLFLQEIQRVGKAGYIEVPDALFERLGTYSCHRLEITERNDILLIRKKKGYIQDEELYELFGHKAGRLWAGWVARHPFHFHVRYYWSRAKGGVKYRIHNPEFVFNWEVAEGAPVTQNQTVKGFVKSKALKFLRNSLSQNHRNGNICLLDYLQCVRCKRHPLAIKGVTAVCEVCGTVYPLRDGVIDFTGLARNQQVKGLANPNDVKSTTD